MSQHEWEGKKLANFKAVHEIYLALHKMYHDSPPDEVPKDYWHDKVISALTAQPILNLPQEKKILYSGKISENANKVVEREGGLTKARKGSGKNAIANEHYFPRKYACKKILEIEEPLYFDEFVQEWETKLGVYHITTKAENADLKAHIQQMLKKNKNFDPLNWENAYRACEINLIIDPRYNIVKDE